MWQSFLVSTPFRHSPKIVENVLSQGNVSTWLWRNDHVTFQYVLYVADISSIKIHVTRLSLRRRRQHSLNNFWHWLKPHCIAKLMTKSSVRIDAESLQWRHNERDSVSNHQPHDCLLNRLFRRRSKKTSKLRVTGLRVGIHRWPVNPPHKWPVTRKIFPFDDVIMIGSKPHNITQYFMECGYLSMSAILAYNTEFLLMITTWIKVVVHGRYFWLWKIIRSRWFDKSSLHFILWCLNRHWFRDWLGVIQTTRYWLIPNYDY